MTISLNPNDIKKCFPFTPIKNIQANLPTILQALENQDLADHDMICMALATISAESEGFVPISEGISIYNTKTSPFDLYDNRKDLGNLGPPDGANYAGKGYTQLTGLYNYKTVGSALGVDLVNTPDLANDPTIAAKILALFLKNRETKIRNTLAQNDLISARKLVNGGTNGLDRFVRCFNCAQMIVPNTVLILEPLKVPITLAKSVEPTSKTWKEKLFGLFGG